MANINTGVTVKPKTSVSVPPLLAQLRNPALTKQVAMALPMNLKQNAEKYMRQMMTLTQLNPALMRCEPATVFGALMNAAALGLELAPALGQCYIIPYKNMAQFQLGYRGMLSLAYKSDQIKSIAAREVCEGEEFEVEFGPEGYLRHKPCFKGKKGRAYAYYAYAVLASGQLIFDVMSYEDMLDFARSNSMSFNSGPWKNHFDEMAKKTMLKRIWKYLPLSTEAQAAGVADEGVKKVTENTPQDIAENILEVPSEYIADDVPTSSPEQEFAGDGTAPLPDSEKAK